MMDVVPISAERQILHPTLEKQLKSQKKWNMKINTLVINLTIKRSFVVHTIIQFLIKPHFHTFSLSYRNLLGSKFLLSLLLNQLSWNKELILFPSEEQSAISQMPTKSRGVH